MSEQSETENKTPLYRFPEEELDRYERHGIAHARLYTMTPIPPLGRCDIDLEGILKIEQPVFAKITHSPQAPEIMIASSKPIKPKREPGSLKVQTFDSNRKLIGLRVEWGGIHPGKDYTQVELIPTYR